MICRFLVTLTAVFAHIANAHNIEEQIRLVSQTKSAVVGVGVYHPLGAPKHKLLGTGFAIQNRGSKTIILTNHHVVNGAPFNKPKTEISVHIGEGKNAKLIKAKLLGQSSRADIALLEINDYVPALSLQSAGQTAPAGSEILIVGLPIGSVLGFYKSAHTGMVAAYVPMAIPQSRANQLTPEVIRQLRDPLFVYQLDATAYPGNSGSPVINKQTGEVIAILNSVKVKSTKEHVLSDPSGISYAIPASEIRLLMKQTL